MKVLRKTLAAALLMSISPLTFGAGFEKATFWSGKYNGTNAAAASIVDDSEAMYFNPAGLAQIEKSQFSLNVSPTWSQFSGPVANNGGNEIKSNAQMSYIPAITGAHRLTDKLVLGLGVYASAGTKSLYESVRFAGFRESAEVGADIAVTEIGLGFAYNLTSKLRLGATWRNSMVDANFSSASVNTAGTALVALRITGMEATNRQAFSFGLQYGEKNDPFGIGLVYKTRVRFSGEGDVNYTPTLASGARVPSSSADARALLSSELPEKIVLGSHYNLSDATTLFFQFDWTHYHRIKKININTNLTAGGTVVPTDVTTDWRDMRVYRFGAEHRIDTWALRAGYSYNSQVTDDNAARATFTPPAATHSATVGLGKKDIFKNADFNLALDRGWGTDEVSTGSGASIPGKYTARAYTAHLGLSYQF